MSDKTQMFFTATSEIMKRYNLRAIHLRTSILSIFLFNAVSALIYADFLATSVMPVEDMHPFVLETHARHHLSGNESRKIRLLWLTVHHLRNYQHSPQKMLI